MDTLARLADLRTRGEAVALATVVASRRPAAARPGDRALVLASGDLLDTVDAALLDSQLPAAMLELEITESTIMQNPQEAAVLLQRLRERGVVLSIDDFGTGHSSLVSLKQYPLDSLKIERAMRVSMVRSR